MENFPVVLASNVYDDMNNTPAHFKTTFQEAIKFKNADEWEVGLVELNFKNSIKTIKDDYVTVASGKTYSKDPIINQVAEMPSIRQIEIKDNAWVLPNGDKVTKWYGVETHGVSIYRIKDIFSIFYAKDQFILYNKSKYFITLQIPKVTAQLMGFTDLTDYVVREEMFTFEKLKPKGVIKSKSIKLKSVEFGERKTPFCVFIPDLEGNTDLYKGERTDHFTSLPSFIKNNTNIFYFLFSIEYETFSTLKEWARLTPNPGTYLNAKELETELNKDPEFNTFFKFDYNQRVNRFEVTSVKKDTDLRLHMHNGLQDVLGFTKSLLFYKEEIQQGELEVNLLRGISSLFIYCDILEPIHVGNVLSPLLRTVAYNTRHYGEMVHIDYVNPIFIKVNKIFIDTITIKLCDSVGELIPFVEGLTTILLNFKRI